MELIECKHDRFLKCLEVCRVGGGELYVCGWCPECGALHVQAPAKVSLGWGSRVDKWITPLTYRAALGANLRSKAHAWYNVNPEKCPMVAVQNTRRMVRFKRCASEVCLLQSCGRCGMGVVAASSGQIWAVAGSKFEPIDREPPMWMGQL